MDGPGEKHVTATARPMSQSAKIAAMQNGNYELFDWRQSNQSLNQEYIEIILDFAFSRASETEHAGKSTSYFHLDF